MCLSVTGKLPEGFRLSENGGDLRLSHELEDKNKTTRVEMTVIGPPKVNKGECLIVNSFYMVEKRVV